ncbi:hypothetical protein [Enterococcus hirae]|uniref:hypothetical protein n=1 Tax=Enterococcus hirae TaxID=1354 RepID=UPI0013628140|nr:hypothetical protein [Enterococcus hirae]EMF0045727.1 hypothetical protein [Enterococcus hirae]EMF0084393.1 hypothetical protein [Enterococcus hirae]EMF0106370.1 hypothetical protein [Enterococcus hirae]EMF0117006.1 hypothetical protein [Enterococcus hirae]EMF0140294.1 hypothetical protein [Enterococcus hirae]
MDKKRLEHPIFLIVQLVDRTFATSQTNALVTHLFLLKKQVTQTALICFIKRNSTPTSSYYGLT